MSTFFSVIVDEFELELVVLRKIVEVGEKNADRQLARIANVRAVILLLAATFEEFVRQMARECAVQTVKQSSNVFEIPDDLLNTAWKRIFDKLAKDKLPQKSDRKARKKFLENSKSDAGALFDFIEGDTSKDIFTVLIKNENNMRVSQINSLFKVSGISDICNEACKQEQLKSFFEEEDSDKVYGEFVLFMEKFINRRNKIVHDLGAASPETSDVVYLDIKFFQAFSKDLCRVLEADTR